jgi:cation:H+ antiporter
MMEETIADNAVLLMIGLAMLVNGSNLVVKAAGSVARRFGISELTIGLTLVAVGTSLPELAAAIIASAANEGALVTGNVVGANVANLTLVIGSAAVLGTIALQRETFERDGYLAIAADKLIVGFIVLE